MGREEGDGGGEADIRRACPPRGRSQGPTQNRAHRLKLGHAGRVRPVASNTSVTRPHRDHTSSVFGDPYGLDNRLTEPNRPAQRALNLSAAKDINLHLQGESWPFRPRTTPGPHQHDSLGKQDVRIRVQREALARVSELRGEVGDRDSLADLHTRVAVSEGNAFRIAIPSTWRVAPMKTRRSGVRSSRGKVLPISSMSQSGQATHRLAARVLPRRTRRRESSKSRSPQVSACSRRSLMSGGGSGSCSPKSQAGAGASGAVQPRQRYRRPDAWSDGGATT